MKTRLTLQTSFYVFSSAFVLAWTVGTAPTAQASSFVYSINIINGGFDVNKDGVVGTADNLAGVLLFFNDAAPIRGDIIAGGLDLDGDGLLNDQQDSLANVDLTYRPATIILPPRRSIEVDVIDGRVDVDGGGVSDSDDFQNVLLVQVPTLPSMEDVVIVDGKIYPNMYNILLAFNDAALARVSIVDNLVDVNQDLAITGADYLPNTDLEESRSGGQYSESVTIRSGFVDVDQDGSITTLDDASDVRVVKLDPSSLPHQVDILDGKVDVDENGIVNAADDLADVLLLFNDAAPTRVDIIDGKVDVNEDGAITFRDDLANADLNGLLFDFFRSSNQVDIIDGLIDVNEDGSITTADDATNVMLFVP
jgi:hypothetical protein